MQHNAIHPKNLIGLILLPFFLVFLPTLRGMDPQKRISQYIRKHWGLEEGLPQTSVQTILQTSDGYIWMGTQEGLVRFDGSRFRVFDHYENEIRLNNISALFEDREKRLWIGTSRSILSYRDGAFTTYSHMENAPEGRISGIVETEPGTLWFGADFGLYRFQSGQFLKYTTSNGLPDNLIQALMTETDGSLWIGTGNGLAFFENSSFQIYSEKTGLLNNKITTLCRTDDSAVWIGSEKGLTRLLEGKMTHFTSKDGLNDDFVQSLYQDRNGILWIGTMSGLNRFYDGKMMLHEDVEPRDHILHITEDWEGNLWVGAWTDSLYQFRDGIVTCFGEPEGFPDNGTRGIIKDREGAYWVGTRAGVVHMDGHNIRVIAKEQGLASNSVYVLMEDEHGDIWVGNRYSGLNRISGTKITVFTTQNGLSDNMIRTLVPHREGGFWIGTYGGGLDHYKDGNFRNISTDDGLSSNLIYTVLEDRDGRVWVGTAGQGLNLIREGKINTYNIEDGLAGNTVVSFYQDDSGDIWIGTTDGLSRYRDGRFANIGVKDGLYDSLAYSIVEDHNGFFWFNSNKAVYTVEKSKLNDFLDGKLDHVSCKSYSVSEGMRSPESNFAGSSTSLQDNDGVIWYTTAKGLVKFNPNSIKVNEKPPPILIEEVRSDPPAISTGDIPKYRTGGRSFEVHYTALSYGEPHKIKFRYMVDGYDDDWRDAGQRRVAYYGSLPPGDYTFKVITHGEKGYRNLEGASFKFKILPRYFQTWWFFLIAILTIVLLARGVFRLRIRQLVSREQKLQDLVTKRTRALEIANSNLVRTQEELVKAAHQAGMADVATNVLHEIGNALNSVNVNSSIIGKDVQGLKTAFLARLVDLINENKSNLSDFLENDPRGKQVIPALNKISETLNKSQGQLLERIKSLDTQILRLNDIIRAQKSHAQTAGAFYEFLDINKFLNRILDAQSTEARDRNITLYRDYQPLPEIQVQKAKLKQVIIHLLTNAYEAVDQEGVQEPEVRIVTRLNQGVVQIQMIDNGIGVDEKAMDRIFFHGYTTKDGRDGFGLHYCANAAREMNGKLRAFNNSPNPGSTFSLEIPFDAKKRDNSPDSPSISIKESS